VFQAGVAQLQMHPTHDGLDVADPGLSLDRQARAETVRRAQSADPAVPRPLVTGIRQRNLGRQQEVWVQSNAKSFQQTDVGQVPDRIRARVGSDADVQPDDGTEPSELAHGDRRRPRALDARDLRRGDPGRAPDRRQREAR
jgi:hypothetical protein